MAVRPAVGLRSGDKSVIGVHVTAFDELRWSRGQGQPGPIGSPHHGGCSDDYNDNFGPFSHPARATSSRLFISSNRISRLFLAPCVASAAFALSLIPSLSFLLPRYRRYISYETTNTTTTTPTKWASPGMRPRAAPHAQRASFG